MALVCPSAALAALASCLCECRLPSKFGASCTSGSLHWLPARNISSQPCPPPALKQPVPQFCSTPVVPPYQPYQYSPPSVSPEAASIPTLPATPSQSDPNQAASNTQSTELKFLGCGMCLCPDTGTFQGSKEGKKPQFKQTPYLHFLTLIVLISPVSVLQLWPGHTVQHHAAGYHHPSGVQVRAAAADLQVVRAGPADSQARQALVCRQMCCAHQLVVSTDCSPTQSAAAIPWFSGRSCFGTAASCTCILCFDLSVLPHWPLQRHLWLHQ
jgi:hypothetical protein